MRMLDNIKLKANDRQAIGEAIRLLKQKYPVEGIILYDGQRPEARMSRNPILISWC